MIEYQNIESHILSLTNPVEGMIAYATDTDIFYVYINNEWLKLVTSIFYGHMYADDISQVVTVSSLDTEYKVSAGISSGLCNGFTFQNNRELKCLHTGTYKVDWGMSVSSGTNNENLSGGVVINTNTWKHDSEGSSNQNNSNNAVHISGTGIYTLSVNDTVGLFVENESAAHNITIRHVNLSIIRIG